MIFTCYGTAKLDPSDLAQSAGDLMCDLLDACRHDPRNQALRRFGQWLRYRHELTQYAMGIDDRPQMIDLWQAPFQTAAWKMGDCEDLSIYFCLLPPRIRRAPDGIEPAAYQAGASTVHAVVAAHGRGDLWQGKPDLSLYVPSLGRTVKRGNRERIGLIDPSFMCGMFHPFGRFIPGHSSDNPGYFRGASRCTRETDLRDRLGVSHFVSERFDSVSGNIRSRYHV